MGCKSSKANKEVPTIDASFETTKVAEFNTFFERAAALLRKVEDTRQGYLETGEKCYELAGTLLVQGNKYLETIKVLFWAISAGSKGQILRSGIRIVDGPPYISISTAGLCDETIALYEALKVYFKTVSEGFKTTKSLVDILVTTKNELLRIESQIDPQVKSYDIIVRNIKKFNLEFTKCKNILVALKTAQQKIEESVPVIRKLASKADRIGNKAYLQNTIKPVEIASQYSLALRKEAVYIPLSYVNEPEEEKDEEDDDENEEIEEADEEEEDDDDEEEEDDEEEDEEEEEVEEEDEEEEEEVEEKTAPTKKASLKSNKKTKSGVRKGSKQLNHQVTFEPKEGKATSKTKKNKKSETAKEKKTTEDTGKVNKDDKLEQLQNLLLLKDSTNNGNNSIYNLQRTLGSKQYATSANKLNNTLNTIPVPKSEDDVYSKFNKINVEAPEMKGLSNQNSNRDVTESPFPRYKFSTISKESPKKTWNNPAPVVQESQPSFVPRPEFEPQYYQNLTSNTLVETSYNVEVQKNTVFPQPIAYQPSTEFQQSYRQQPLAYFGDENIEDEDQENSKNLPDDSSSNLVQFSELRQQYMLGMKS